MPTAKSKTDTPEQPNEPDLFDKDKLEADENEADFDVEETNKKEDTSK